MLTAALLTATALTGCSTGPPTHRAGNAAPPVSRSTADATSGTGPATPTSPGGGPAASSTTAACSDQSVVAAWPTALKAAQVVAVPVLHADPASVAVAVSHHAGGMLLLGAMPAAPQLESTLRSAVTGRPGAGGSVAPPPSVMVDQEGGGVQRLGGDVLSIPWPRQMAASMSVAEVTQLARTLGRQMASLGVGVDLAPVLDLDGGAELSATDPDGPRSFSTDPAAAAAYGDAFAAGLQAGGVLAVAKHFPGLGGASGNTDYGPASTRPIGELQASDLLPFRHAIASGVRAVMVANATVPGLAPKPASLSGAVITGLLRDQLHFGGLVMTDSLSAGAIRAAGYDLASAAVVALQAGADMLLFGSTLTAADTAALVPAPLAAQTKSLVDAITQAVASGALPAARLDAAALHVVQSKGLNLC